MTLSRFRSKASAGILSVVLLVGMAPLSAWAADQPHMRAALEALERAKQQLQAAEHDKGGHRAKALELTDRAIQQVKSGMAFAEQHERGKGRDRNKGTH